MVTEEKISRFREFLTSHTSQNPWMTLRSPGNTRIRHQNPSIRIFWCLRVPTATPAAPRYPLLHAEAPCCYLQPPAHSPRPRPRLSHLKPSCPFSDGVTSIMAFHGGHGQKSPIQANPSPSVAHFLNYVCKAPPYSDGSYFCL